MGSLASVALSTPPNFASRIAQARARTDEMFNIVREEAMYDRPIPERHRIIFYLGHVEAFDWNLLGDRAFGLRPFHKAFDRLFAFGIDPVDGGLPTDQPSDWPALENVARYNARLRAALDDAMQEAQSRPREGHPNLSEMIETAIEHRLLHAETLAYILHRLPSARKIPGPPEPDWRTPRFKRSLVDS